MKQCDQGEEKSYREQQKEITISSTSFMHYYSDLYLVDRAARNCTNENDIFVRIEY